jgi:hypothetical protein
MHSAMSDFIETNNFNKFSLDLNLGERASLRILFLQLTVRHFGSLIFLGFLVGLVESEDLWKR